MRCPVGISNWAPQLVQIPAPQFDQHSPFNCASFQYCIAFVASLLMPIKDRNRFLERMTKDLNNSIDPVEDDIWVLVDSEGEEGNTPTGECVGLKENDLVSLFDQIPLEQVFRMLTLIESKNGELGLDDNKITGHHLIKSIAFATKFIGILRTGLKTYDTERYKQFGKRLGRLVKHTVFYVADLIKLFLKNSKNYKDPAECQRIRIEFDLLVIRAINYIYESQMLSLWQYLVDFPYEMMETRSIWRLLYYLHLGEFYEVDGKFFSFKICLFQNY